MRKIVEVVLTPSQAYGDTTLHPILAKALRIKGGDIRHVAVLKRSIDSRSRRIWIRAKVEVFIHEDPPAYEPIEKSYPNISNGKRVLIAGAGPAGLFAALRLIELGWKPVILERGKDVHARKADIADLNSRHRLHPDSNYCFGEGGAGTFSDGKLYTRSHKRGNVDGILDTLIFHGAPAEIRIDAHPHIGSDKLPRIIEAVRNTILQVGGEIHFNTRLCGLTIKGRAITGVTDQHGNTFEGKALIMATGHSAHDIYELLHSLHLPLEAKAFAMGVRVEHPQALIDSIQYHTTEKDPYLPPATYSLTHQASGRGVFSFCMCPGGIIVPAATGPEQVVVNGMSNSLRNSPYANAGMVVGVEPGDLAAYSSHGPLMGLRFQEAIEKVAFLAGGSCQAAPAQRLTDFLEHKTPSSLPATSYHPGTLPYPIHQVLPEWITRPLQEGFLAFNDKMKGFITQEAIILAVESRTSSPVRIPRHPETLQYTGLDNVYPAGEGAGYAGGIMSSAIDGERVAEALAHQR